MAADAAQAPAAAAARKPAWTATPIILGSQSASRKGVLDQLAKELDFTYSTVSADIDEKAIRLDDPSELVLALAEAKADAILRQWIEDDALPDEGLLITCDQVVIGQDQILEKPESEEEARQMIAGYSESAAVTVGSVRVLNLASGEVAQATDSCQVDFKAIPDDVIDKLIAEGSVYQCAGGLMVEHPLVSPLIEEMHGEIESVMGLPRQLLLDLLRKANLTLREVNPEKPPSAF